MSEQMTDTPTTPLEIAHEALKPCPFCGGEGEMSYYARVHSPDLAGRHVECVSCSALGPSVEIQGEAPDRDDYTKSKAAEMWNERTPTTQLEIAREALEKIELELREYREHWLADGCDEAEAIKVTGALATYAKDKLAAVAADGPGTTAAETRGWNAAIDAAASVACGAGMAGDWSAQSPEVGEFNNKSTDEILFARAVLYYRMADATLAARAGGDNA